MVCIQGWSGIDFDTDFADIGGGCGGDNQDTSSSATDSPSRSRKVLLHMETLTEAMRRLRAKGYVHDLQASQDGQLRCGTCGSFSDPENVAIAETIRFEGDSNPDDQAILIAVVCPGGCLAQFSAAFGPTAAALDTEVLQRLTNVVGK